MVKANRITMKILTIRLKNLASIEGTFEIDFQAEPLRSAGIFAISGPTGAGKSTILDALCLALYDKTPRFSASVESLYMSDIGESRVNQADVKNILRRGTGEGFAEVDFLGVSGHCYRSRWSVRRTGSRLTCFAVADDTSDRSDCQSGTTGNEERVVGTIGDFGRFDLRTVYPYGAACPE